jgi:hypothetical protein
MKTKAENKLKYSTQEELLSFFKEEKKYPLSFFFRKSNPKKIAHILKELFALAAITCLLLAGFIFLF